MVRAAGRTAAAANDKDYVAAVNELLNTYQELTELLKELGLRQASALVRKRLGAAPPGVQLVPTTDELRKGLLQPEGRS